MILALAISFHWDIRQLNISNSFLHGLLKEEVYMLRPKDFVDPAHPHFVCKLYKSLYGLKQAPCTWFNRLSTALLALGFHSSLVDPLLFTYHIEKINAFLLECWHKKMILCMNMLCITSIMYSYKLKKDIYQWKNFICLCIFTPFFC